MSNPPIERLSPFVPLGQIAIISSASVDTSVAISLERGDTLLRVLQLHVLTAGALDVVKRPVTPELNRDSRLRLFVLLVALANVIGHSVFYLYARQDSNL